MSLGEFYRVQIVQLVARASTQLAQEDRAAALVVSAAGDAGLNKAVPHWEAIQEEATMRSLHLLLLTQEEQGRTYYYGFVAKAPDLCEKTLLGCLPTHTSADVFEPTKLTTP